MNITRRTALRGALLGGFALVVGGCSNSNSKTVENTGAAESAADHGAEGTQPTTYEYRTFDLHCDTIDALPAMIRYIDSVMDPNAGEGTLAENTIMVNPAEMDCGWAQCYGIWLPGDGNYKLGVNNHEFYRMAADYFHAQMEAFPETLVQITDARAIEEVIESGRVAAMLTVENAACLDDGIQVIDEMAEDGVKVASLTWNTPNVLGSGNETEDGLTSLGREAITAFEEHNIVLDVSHLNDTGFWELESIATRPYIATHSNSRAVHDNLRNLTDEQFICIAERGGLVGLNLYGSFVANGKANYTYDDLIAHVKHWLELGGEDAVALGADNDGSDQTAEWIKGCDKYGSFYRQVVNDPSIGKELADKLFFTNALDFFIGYDNQYS